MTLFTGFHGIAFKRIGNKAGETTLGLPSQGGPVVKQAVKEMATSTSFLASVPVSDLLLNYFSLLLFYC